MKFILKHRILILILIGISVFYHLVPLPKPLFNNDYSTIVLDQNNQILRVFLNNEQQWCLPPDSNLILPEKLKKTVIFYEDKYFNWHFGINPLSIIRATKQNVLQKNIHSGASTITMQVARLIQPKSRTYLNKIFEMLQAVKIELIYSKDEILSLYLNHAPYGGNIIGYQAAALRYFKCLPNQLSWGQAATLAVIPNAPGLISPQSNPDLLKRKRNILLKKMFSQGIIDRSTFQLACLEEIPRNSNIFDFFAPHLCRVLKNKQKSTSIIKTTIDIDIQKNIENIVSLNSSYLKNLGIKNAAALIVETQSGAVKGYVGSSNFFDSASLGQVDGVLAQRSSGSILKPFLYALSIDEGYILPQSLIKDIPSFYGSFSPENADLNYRGIISAERALSHSLNVPAVRLLYQYGNQPFYYFLKEAGLTTLFRQPQDYGLSLILGGAETNLWDMATLYKGLAKYGKFNPIHVIKNEKPSGKNSKNQLISSGASYLTLGMLNKLNRPGSEFYWHQYQNHWPLAWKTGTSYGQRDGWAIGVNPQWTIAVWVGNFDGVGNASLSGAASAAPILFNIFNTLPKKPELDWFIKPDDKLRKIKICSQSGFYAHADCPQTEMIDAPVFMKPIKNCPFHKKFFLSDHSLEQVCSLCWSFTNYHSVVKMIYPPDVSQYLRQNGQVIETIPRHNPLCSASTEENPVQIIYPQQNSAFWIPRDFGGKIQKIHLRVAHQQKNCRIYWYLDDLFKGTSFEKHEMALFLDKGWHELEVVDESGYSNKVRFYANLKQ